MLIRTKLSTDCMCTWKIASFKYLINLWNFVHIHQPFLQKLAVLNTVPSQEKLNKSRINYFMRSFIHSYIHSACVLWSPEMQSRCGAWGHTLKYKISVRIKKLRRHWNIFQLLFIFVIFMTYAFIYFNILPLLTCIVISQCTERKPWKSIGWFGFLFHLLF